MDYSFDYRGYLKPYRKVEMKWSDFETLFVQTNERRHLFEELLRYNENLYGIIKSPFYQWMNGSFVTKQNRPKDVDVVTFIRYDTYDRKEQQIDAEFSKWQVGNFYKGLDAYTVWEYPESHRFYSTFKADCAYWYNWFSTTRANRAKKKYPKGFVELKYNN
ncbi:MAG: hypothetical protein AAGG68_29635 [Bacteroidota bacterium]